MGELVGWREVGCVGGENGDEEGRAFCEEVN